MKYFQKRQLFGTLSWSPSLRGSGLKSTPPDRHTGQKRRSPSLRGSGLKSVRDTEVEVKKYVSLFTREWIEILPFFRICMTAWSPSLRGSGLKFSVPCYLDNGDYVSLFTREWIEILRKCIETPCGHVSLFTREWIEIGSIDKVIEKQHGLPLYEGVD